METSGSTMRRPLNSDPGGASAFALSRHLGSTLRSVLVERFTWEGSEDPHAVGALTLGIDDVVVAVRGGPGGGDYLVCDEQEGLPTQSESRDGWASRPADCSERLVGRQLTAVVPLVNQFGLTAGVRLVFEGEAITFLSQADEHYFFAGSADSRVAELGFSEGTLPTTSTKS